MNVLLILSDSLVPQLAGPYGDTTGGTSNLMHLPEGESFSKTPARTPKHGFAERRRKHGLRTPKGSIAERWGNLGVLEPCSSLPCMKPCFIQP